jgi:hypothetical protein
VSAASSVGTAAGLPGALQRAVPGVVVDPDRPTARQWAVEELAQQEYVQAQPNLLMRALIWVLDQLDGLLLAGAGAGVAVGLVVGLAVVLAVVVVAVLLAGPLRVSRARRRGRADAVFGGTVRTAAQHREAATRAAEQQRWAEAVQESFRAAARTMEERVVLDPRPGRTADEIAVEGGAALPEAATALARAARAFDDVTYGDRPGDGSRYALCLEADDAVRRARPRGLLAAVTSAGTSGGPQVPA